MGKLWLLTADVWRKWCGGMEGDDNVAWSRAPSSHTEKRRAESRSVFEVIGMCIFPFWLSVLLGPVSPSYLFRLPQHSWQTSSSVVTTCVYVCFSVRFHKLTLHLHITRESFIHWWIILQEFQSQKLLKVSFVCYFFTCFLL